MDHSDASEITLENAKDHVKHTITQLQEKEYLGREYSLCIVYESDTNESKKKELLIYANTLLTGTDWTAKWVAELSEEGSIKDKELLVARRET